MLSVVNNNNMSIITKKQLQHYWHYSSLYVDDMLRLLRTGPTADIVTKTFNSFHFEVF